MENMSLLSISLCPAPFSIYIFLSQFAFGVFFLEVGTNRQVRGWKQRRHFPSVTLRNFHALKHFLHFEKLDPMSFTENVRLNLNMNREILFFKVCAAGEKLHAVLTKTPNLLNMFD